jgi:transposase
MRGEAMSDLISIALDIPDVRVLKVEDDAQGDILITVESTVDGTRCRRCGRETKEFHGQDGPITLRHLPILGRRVYIRLRPKRYRCPYCQDHPTTSQRLDWYDPRSPNTKAYENHILLQLVNSTVQDVSVKEQIGYETVVGIVRRHIGTEVAWDEYERIEVVGLDEIALRKGHRDFVVIVTGKVAGGRVVILAVLPDRTKRTVKAFLQSIPGRLKATIEAVCTDMYEGFIQAVKEELPTARVIIDRFHVAKKYRACADDLRKKEMRRLKTELSPKEYEVIKGTMWAFRKDPVDLTAEEAHRLEQLFAHSPALETAYRFREDLSAIFDRNLSKAKATKKIKHWVRRVQASELTCFTSFLTTLEERLDEITNYFLDRRTSGFVEGLNNKIKVLKRRCYGLFNISHLFQRLYLDLEGYRLFAKTCC